MVRNFSVGLVALATLAAAGLVWRRKRLIGSSVLGAGTAQVEPLYTAGL